jgi:uncharacterized protein involved in outer membrane biogenesis
MKKILIRIVIVLVVLVIAAGIALSMFLDDAVKKGVETVGPQLTKVSIRLDGVNLSVLSGSGSIKGFEMGNPDGYKSPHAMTVGSASVAVSPGSLLADKVVVKHLRLEAPQITIEGSPMNNNLTKILDNVKASSGSSDETTPAESESGAGKKMQVDEFLMKDAKVTYVISGQSYVLNVPEIKLTGLGAGPDGITAAELTDLALSKLISEVGPILSQEASKLGKQAVDSALDKANQKLNEFLKPK